MTRKTCLALGLFLALALTGRARPVTAQDVRAAGGDVAGDEDTATEEPPAEGGDAAPAEGGDAAPAEGGDAAPAEGLSLIHI